MKFQKIKFYSERLGQWIWAEIVDILPKGVIKLEFGDGRSQLTTARDLLAALKRRPRQAPTH